jgi:hypothetical protein
MKFKGLLLMGLSAGIVGMAQTDVAHANVPWLNITDKSVPRTDFVDISSHNGVPTVQEFKIMKNYGVKGVMVKLTEATSYRNPYAASQIANAKAAGLTVGGYHYSWYTDEATARAEGRYFAQFAKELGLPANTPMADDLEEPQVKYANLNGKVNTHTKAFRAGVSGAGYTNNILYTYGSYATESGLSTASFGKKNVWMASYPFSPSKDSLWHTDVGMWQFNSNMHFPNVRGTFDANIDYVGAMSGGASASKPSPTPKPTTYKYYFKFNQTNRKDGLFANAPYRYQGAKKVGTAPNATTVWVEKREVASNGVVWYYAKVNGQYVWFDAQAGSIVKVSDLNATTVNKDYIFNQTSRKDGLYATAPYGLQGYKNVGNPKHNATVRVEKQVVSNGTTWFYGTVNGQKVWFDARAAKLKPKPVEFVTIPVNQSMMTKQTSRKDGMFLNAPYRYTGAKKIGNVPNATNVWVEKQHKATNGTIWYYATINGQKVWFDSLAVTPLATTTVNKYMTTNQTSRKDGMFLNAPYRYAGAKKVGNVPHGQKIWIEKQHKATNGVIWYYASINGQKVWFDSLAVKAATPAPTISSTPVKKYITTNQTSRKDGMFLNAPYRYTGAKKVGNMPHGRLIWVEKQHKATNGVVWYYGEVNGQKIWFDSMSGSMLKVSDRKHTTVNGSYVFNQTSRKDGLYTTAPYGFAGAKSAGKATNGVKVKVDKKLVNDGVTWFYGTVNGQKVWFDARAVKAAPSGKKAMVEASSDTEVSAPKKSESQSKVASKRSSTESKVVSSSSTSATVESQVKQKSVTSSERQMKESSETKKSEESSSVVRDVNFDFIFDQTKREDDLYKEVKGMPVDTKVLRPAVDKEILHVTKQFVDEDGTIWYGAKLNKDFVWFETKAGRVNI